MTVTADDIREHIESDLADTAIDRLLADAVAAIGERAGSAAAQTILLDGGNRFLMLPQPISAAADVTEIKETYNDPLGQLTTTLDGTDWRWWGGRKLERIVSGTNPAGLWAAVLELTYTPKADADRRDRVTIDLVRLAIQHNALGSERAGDYSSTSVDYQNERDKILRELVSVGGFA